MLSWALSHFVCACLFQLTRICPSLSAGPPDLAPDLQFQRFSHHRFPALFLVVFTFNLVRRYPIKFHDVSAPHAYRKNKTAIKIVVAKNVCLLDRTSYNADIRKDTER